MHRRVIIVAALAVATAVVPIWRSSWSDDMACETTLDFNGVTYTVYELTEEITATGDLGVGIERGCGDNARWSDDVAVSRIAGVNPRTALVTPVAAHALYVAEGVAIDELPGKVAEIVAQ